MSAPFTSRAFQTHIHAQERCLRSLSSPAIHATNTNQITLLMLIYSRHQHPTAYNPPPASTHCFVPVFMDAVSQSWPLLIQRHHPQAEEPKSHTSPVRDSNMSESLLHILSFQILPCTVSSDAEAQKVGAGGQLNNKDPLPQAASHRAAHEARLTTTKVCANTSCS